jgi:hypothetical protein
MRLTCCCNEANYATAIVHFQHSKHSKMYKDYKNYVLPDSGKTAQAAAATQPKGSRRSARLQQQADKGDNQLEEQQHTPNDQQQQEPQPGPSGVASNQMRYN